MTTLKCNNGDWVSDHIRHTPDNFAERCIVCPLSRGEYYFALFHFSLLPLHFSLFTSKISFLTFASLRLTAFL